MFPLLCALPLAFAPAQDSVEPGALLDIVTIGDWLRPFRGTVGPQGMFCGAIARVGDLDGDGTIEFAFGVPDDRRRGSVWIASRAADGSFGPFRLIALGLPSVGGGDERLGVSLAPLGDLDGDGVPDLAAGDGADVELMFLRADGTVREMVRIEGTPFGLPPVQPFSSFSLSLLALGDRNGDGFLDLWVGAPRDDDGGFDRGAVWKLQIDSNGSVRASTKLSQTSGFPATLPNRSFFGASMAEIGDVNGDGTSDVAVGAVRTGSRGDVWILLLDPDGNVIGAETFDVPARFGIQFGQAIAGLGDLDGDGLREIAVGAPQQALETGSVYIFSLGADGLPVDSVEVESAVPTVPQEFGAALCSCGPSELMVGHPRWRLNGGLSTLEFGTDLTPINQVALQLEELGIEVAPAEGQLYGRDVVPLGDLDRDGFPDLAASAFEDGSFQFGSVSIWIHFLDSNGDGTRARKLVGGRDFEVPMPRRLRGIRDFDGNGTRDLIIENAVQAWILLLGGDGRVLEQVPLPAGVPVLSPGDVNGDGTPDIVGHTVSGQARLYFLDSGGTAIETVELVGPEAGTVATPGDVDGNGVPDLVYLEQVSSTSAVLEVVLLESTGAIANRVEVMALDLPSTQRRSVGSVGDLDGDGTPELTLSIEGGAGVLFLNSDGSLKDSRFYGSRNTLISIFGVGDLTGDGVPDLGVGSNLGSGSIFLFLVDGLARLDFERNDDLDLRELPNGRAVGPAAAFGRTVQIQGFSGQGLGAAVFDSNPLGPNASSSDPDLLVDRGNVLILQENGAQSQPGVFDVPDDALAGGTLRFDFDGREVECHAIDLVDVCPSPGNDMIVMLTDALGRTRAYVVPSGWTGDVAVDNHPGWGRLDLRETAPQPGFLTNATSSETAGFDPRRVVSLEVILNGSGAVDNLVYDPRD